MNSKIKIIIVVITLIAIVAIIKVLKTSQLNKKLEIENKQSQQLLVELREKQNQKVTRELTELLQDAQFIMEVDSNCPPDEMINEMNDLYHNHDDLEATIQANYEKVLNLLEARNCD